MDWNNQYIQSIVLLIAITVAFLTSMLLVAATVLAERRVLALIQGRLGPNRVGYGGVLQPFADFIKTMMKEDLVPDQSTRFVFLLAPMIAVVTAIMTLIVYPFGRVVFEQQIQLDGRAAIFGADDFLRVGVGAFINRCHSDFRHARHLQHRRAAIRLVRLAMEYFLSTAGLHALPDCRHRGNEPRAVRFTGSRN